ncbi:MAG: ligase-associated DNA damage response endonuclease PdeM [Pseudomonadota bacterium]
MTVQATLRSDAVKICVRGELFTPLPEGAIWWPERSVLVVSDLHLEKGSSYAALGQMLPPYDTSSTLACVEGLVASLRPETVISLGDSFHDGKAEMRLSSEDARRIRALTESTDWIWVEGNHDPVPPAALGGRAADEIRLGSVNFRHLPTGESGEIAGHLHPCARVVSRVRALRRRCFVTDGDRLIMPAMGAYTGGLNVLDRAYEDCFPEGGMMVFAMAKQAVIPISRKRLLPDNSRPDLGKWRL